MNTKQYEDFIIKTAESLLAIDSPSGFTGHASDYILDTVRELGYPVYRNKIGNVIVTVDGEDNEESVAYHQRRISHGYSSRGADPSYSGRRILPDPYARRQGLYRNNIIPVSSDPCIS